MRRLVLLMVLAGCAKATPPSGQPAPDPTEPPPPGAMIGHFLKATAAQDAVIAHDLAGARAAGSVLAATPTSRYPERYQPFLPALVVAAEALSSAGDIDAAADAVGQVGAACAACHIATGGGPAVQPVEVPSFEDGEQMALHQWAYDRLWLGLLAPNDPAWMQATTAMSATPLPAARAYEDAVRARQAGSLQALVELGKIGITAEAGERPGLYGRGLAQCGSCHATRVNLP